MSFAPDTLPMNRDGVQVRPDLWNEKDGFSTLAPMLTWFDDLSLDGVVGHQNLADYAAADAKILLVDAETGERVPVWAELDTTAEDDGQRMLMIWPAVPLEHARRYVVGLRGLQTNAGGSVAVSEAFAALRDGVETEDYDIEGRRAHFDEVVFPALEAQGVARGDLQLAWDYVTVSRESSLGRMEFMREDGIARFDQAGQPYRIKSVEDHDCTTEPIARDIQVVATMPYYTEAPTANTILARDANGMPAYQGDTEIEFLVRVPCSVAEDPAPARVLQYGHGLLGDYGEAYTGWLSRFANEHGYIVVAHTWHGMSEEDVPAITVALVNDVTDFAIIPERSHQGYLEAMLAMQLTLGALASDEALTYEGVSVVDPTKTAYYGNSQGGIMGGAYLAMSPHIDRGVLGVPGMPYALLLTRSADFDPFFLIFKQKYTDHREINLLIGMMEALWEPAEAAGWAHVMNRDPDAELGPKQALIHPAIYDAQVTTLGAHIMARAYGAQTVAPQTRPIFGVEEAQPGFTGSAIVEWLYTDVPDEPVTNTPPDKEHDTHECPRREPEGQLQIADFLETGVVNQYCDGVCSGLREGLCD